MNRRRATALVIAAVATPFLVTGVVLLAIHRGDGAEVLPPGPAPAAKSFNVTGLPPIHTDPCPGDAELLPAPATGDKVLPDLTLECIGDIGTTQTVALRRLGRLPTVVNLWSTSCEPCRREMPDLQSVYAAAAGKVRILGVDTQDYAEGARATINNTEVRYPSLADPAAKLRTAVGSNFMPTTLFVDANGKIVFRRVGAFPDVKAIRAAITEHLGVTL